MNLGTLRTQASTFVGDVDQTRFTAAQYNTAIDRAQEQFRLDTRALWKHQSFTTADGDADYNLPSDFQWEDWVTYDGKELPPISRHEIQRIYGEDWADQNGDPTHFVIDPEEAVKELLLVPTPNEAKTVILRYFPLPASLSADSSVPLNSSALLAQFHIGIAAYAAWLILMGETETVEILAKKRELMGLYEKHVSQAIQKFGNTVSAPINIRGSRLWS